MSKDDNLDKITAEIRRQIIIADDNAAAEAILKDVASMPHKYSDIRNVMVMTREDIIKYLKLGVAADKSIKEITVECDTYQQEYKLACAANKGLSAALDKEREENKQLRLQMFAFVRNSSVVLIGLKNGWTEQKIADETFATIAEAKKLVDVDKMIKCMNLATDKENRYDRE